MNLKLIITRITSTRIREVGGGRKQAQATGMEKRTTDIVIFIEAVPKAFLAHLKVCETHAF